MKITWLVYGHQTSIGEPAPKLGEIELEVADDKYKLITLQQAHDLAQQRYGYRYGYVVRKSRTEYHPEYKQGERTITIYE